MSIAVSNEVSQRDTIVASSIREGMPIMVPGHGMINVTNLRTENGRIFVTNLLHDFDVDAPVASFEINDPVSLLLTDL